MWGHTGRHRNGAVLFHTFVRAWKYTEPDPLYGKYTTKEWTRYIIECQPDIEPADAFIYRNESFTLYSREELERLVGILHGELFNGFRPGLFILWAYRMEWKELPTWEWNMLKAETHLFFLGVSPVKIRTDHNGHTVTFYKKQNNMTRYETSPEVRPLEKTICEFAGLNGYDPMNVFTDFLRYVIHGFSPGAPPLKDWRYKRQQNAAFMKMFAEWVRLMQKQLEAASWYDALGDLFMALSSRKGQQAQGQFFTPVHICDLMVMCTETDGKKTGQRINDPTCGSGRLLLAYHVRHLGNYLVAEDVNRTCCLMTICNMLIHGCVGEVIHHDSLCTENFMDGWMVNHTLTQTGIPSIRRMSEEEYRTSRNMSVDLLRKRKEKLRQMQPDKKQLP